MLLPLRCSFLSLSCFIIINTDNFYKFLKKVLFFSISFTESERCRHRLCCQSSGFFTRFRCKHLSQSRSFAYLLRHYQLIWEHASWEKPMIKDMLIVKPPLKYSLVIGVVAFVIVCGVFMCSVGLKQISSFTKAGFVDVQVVERPCEKPNIEKWEESYVHYPKPTTFSRAECACNPVRYFAILSTQRSGSGWFETLLNNHTNVSSNGEIFSVKPRRSNISTIVDTLDKIYNLDWLTSASKNECTAAVGLKWMLNQGLMQNHDEIAEYFKKNGVSAIFLFRRNLLRRMVSILANSYDQSAKPLGGKHKSHVHSPDEAKVLAKYKPTINTTLLIPNLKQVDDMVMKALEYFKSTRHIIIYYEDVINNRTIMNDVQDFLRVPRMELKSRQVKIHKGALHQQIENWADVQKTLKGTPYESFLHEDYKIR